MNAPTTALSEFDADGDGHILFPSGSIHRDAGLLARFLTDLRFEDIPPDALHNAKLIVLDTIGCIVAGTDTPLGKSLLEAYSGERSREGCAIPGTALSAGPSMATKLNAWLADILDYEDVAVGHPSATVIPAAMAMAEHIAACPRRFLAGVVGGYEAGIRLHDATQASPEIYKRFAVYHAWHGFAAGAAAMVVSGGTEEQFRSALGHAAANTSLPLWYVQYGRPAHSLKANYGQMALGGIDAALCARQDIIGPFAMLSDPERGFARIIGSDNFGPSSLSRGLGERWRIREASLKAYPSCAFLHTTIDAINTLVDRHSVDHRNVDKVTIRCFSRIPHWFSDAAPASDIDAQLSVQYVSAMALMRVEVGRNWYAPSMLSDPAASRLMRKIAIEVDPASEEAFWSERKYRSTVVIEMNDGVSVSETVDWARGHWRRPFSDEDVAGKFLANLRETSLEATASEIIDLTMDLDRSESLAGLWVALRGR